MADILDAIDNLPDISFIDDLTLQDMQNLMITAYQDKWEELTGETIHLKRADPNRIILLASAQFIYQGLLNVDKAGKMNFLKYSYGDYLKHLAAFKNTPELEQQKATVSVRWSLAEARAVATAIPEGTRATADWETFFETTEYNEIPAGETEIIVTMTCTETGEKGNGFQAGEIIEMVDPLPFIDSIENTTESAGGTDEESEQSLAERAYLAPSGYSTAGPEDAYIYHAKSYDPEIGDILPTSPSPGVVDIRFIKADGSLPTAGEIAGLKAYLEAADRKPLTDSLQIGAPTAVNYQIAATYYINKSDQSSAAAIQGAALQALEDYQAWQCGKIGRDINPDELLGLLKQAGVKRVVITYPQYTELTQAQVAHCTAAALTYGGLEND